MTHQPAPQIACTPSPSNRGCGSRHNHACDNWLLKSDKSWLCAGSAKAQGSNLKQTSARPRIGLAGSLHADLIAEKNASARVRHHGDTFVLQDSFTLLNIARPYQGACAVMLTAGLQ